MKAVVSIAYRHSLCDVVMTKVLIAQVLFSIMVATAVAKPQYGAQSSAQGFISAPQQQWADVGHQQQLAIAPPHSSNHQISPEEWASLSPYGTNINAYPAEERPRIEEIQRQWMSFLEYLPWLKVT